MAAKKSSEPWWSEGIRFRCQGSGKCCVSHGEFGYVYLTLDDRRRMAKKLGLGTSAFTAKYCRKTDGVFHLRDGVDASTGKITPECVFLEKKRCQVYEARPMQCRTWPFWPEVMNAKTWAKDVQTFCPGIGKGPVVTADEIQIALAAQEDWEDQLKHGL